MIGHKLTCHIPDNRDLYTAEAINKMEDHRRGW